jgi:hypothetical protein
MSWPQETTRSLARRCEGQVLLSLVQGPQTAGAQIHTPDPATVVESDPLDVGLELTICSPLRVTNVVPKLRLLATELAFRHRVHHLALVRSEPNHTTRQRSSQLGWL